MAYLIKINNMAHRRCLYNSWEDWVHAEYHNKIQDECKNFVFFKDGSMKYDFERFSDYVEAMIDAVRNGEDIDRVVSLVFREKVDHPIVKMKLIKLMNDSNYGYTRI